MSNWFQDHQTVLVYHPGSGGEHICCKLNGQKELSDKNNKHRCINSFPGSDRIYDKVYSKSGVSYEWSEECRITFESEKELKAFVIEDPDWKLKSGNPDRLKPRLGQRTVIDNVNHFPTHWCFGLFREPVYKWLDCDNDYWIKHWDLVLDIKDHYFEKEIQESIGKWLKYSEAEKDFYSFKNRYLRYREYYKTRFPNSVLLVEELAEKVNYKQWAKTNLRVAERLLKKHNIKSKYTDEVFDKFPL